MGWHTWTSWLANQAVSTANLTKILDMLNYLKGKAGEVEIESNARFKAPSGKSLRVKNDGAAIDLDVIGTGVDAVDLWVNFGKDIESLTNKWKITKDGVLSVGSVPFARLNDFAANHGNVTNGVHGVAAGDTIEVVSRKNQPNGYCGLDAFGKVSDSQLAMVNAVRIADWPFTGIAYTSNTYGRPAQGDYEMKSYLRADFQGNRLALVARHWAHGPHGIRLRNSTNGVVVAEHWHDTHHLDVQWCYVSFTAPSGFKEYVVEVRGYSSLGIYIDCANLVRAV